MLHAQMHTNAKLKHKMNTKCKNIRCVACWTNCEIVLKKTGWVRGCIRVIYGPYRSSKDNIFRQCILNPKQFTKYIIGPTDLAMLHSSPSRLVQIPDCPRHSHLTNSNKTEKNSCQDWSSRVHNTRKYFFSPVPSIKLIYLKTRYSSELETTKFPVFSFLKPNRIPE